MRQLVVDMAGNHEYIEFVPVNSWASCDRIEDNLFDHRFDYVDHRFTTPEDFIPSAVKSAMNAQIYSHDKSDFIERPTINPCFDLPKSIHRNGAFAPHMARAYTDILKTRDAVEAARVVNDAHERLTEFGYSYAMSDDEITDLAKRKSRDFSRTINAIPAEYSEARFNKACELLESLGLAFSEKAIGYAKLNCELFALVNRALDEHWLVRQLRRKCAYEVERVARDLALVQRRKQVYCSDFSLSRQRDRNSSNRIALDNTIAYDEDDKSNYFTLSELSEKSVSNPEIRRNEMFVRLRGFEEIAQESNHDAVFFTVTAPSRFHSVSNGAVNPNWLEADKPDAKTSHKYLMGVWSNLRKALDKNKIKVYGMRIVEPHQDGTPHHHLLLFMEKSSRKFVTSEFRRLAMADTPDEKGAKKYRFKAEVINWSKGSAVGYVAKYLSKNIDGQHIQSDKGSSLTGSDAAERVVTWARVNQIRQFQFIGGPSVTVWREMRRLREEFKEDDALFTDLNQDEHFLLEKVRRSADEGDWKAFCYAMGGVFVKRKDQTVKAEYTVSNAIEKLIASGGEYSPTRYGDMAQARLNGLMFQKVFIATRFRNWKTENKEQFLRAQQGIMENVVDYFDALEREKEYERMCDDMYEQYEQQLAQYEEMQALLFTAPEEIGATNLEGEAPPDWWH
ncbi:replication endonuclease [Vibrio parahaemolyticus]|uniref:replication endonuclease n=1 Tax=Vibrio parahaemolyticus TaxID=670 RepID=UPI001121FD92|nr:replication endonuclease [Vibrio parahaemolyticus]TOE05985.1 replication protein [Vibrio parahaemolyticus]TOE07983.1 replication protein [Vibrio parahaemolyticus]TOE18932.1 replication protein [Vibrio parahaemolyticus]